MSDVVSLIQAGNNCDVCHRQFHDGDRAIVLVRVPIIEFDTICVEDWSIMLASCAKVLVEDRAWDRDAVKSLLEAALDDLYSEDV